LGTESDAFHAALADPVRSAGVEQVVLVGEEMAPLAKALGGSLELTHVPDASAATEIVRQTVRPGDAILVKGSNSLGLARLVEALAGDRLS